LSTLLVAVEEVQVVVAVDILRAERLLLTAAVVVVDESSPVQVGLAVVVVQVQVVQLTQ
jgi:hypothetical protein